MKKIVHFFVVIAISTSTSAQFELNTSYSMAIPLGEMTNNINLTHSLAADVRYHFKKTKCLWAGTELVIGEYAVKSQKQLYQYSNGSTTEAKVNFSSNVFKAHLFGGVDLLPGKAITPYIVAKAGLSNFFTNVYIPDPNDQGSCQPLENRNAYNDVTWSAATGVGIKVGFNKIFNNSRPDRLWFDLSANYLFGGTISYLNVKNITEFTDDTNYAGKGFNVSFVNLDTHEVHQHHVAEIYTTPLRQLDLKLGVLIRL